MSKRDNKAAAAEFRELLGMEFDEFTRQAPVKLLLALANSRSRSIPRCCSSRTRRIRCFSGNARR